MSIQQVRILRIELDVTEMLTPLPDDNNPEETQDALGKLRGMIQRALGLARVRVELDVREETWSERLAREAVEVTKKREALRQDQHDLYATCDEDTPEAICDGNGEVVMALCRKCNRMEYELHTHPVCDQTYPTVRGGG